MHLRLGVLVGMFVVFLSAAVSARPDQPRHSGFIHARLSRDDQFSLGYGSKRSDYETQFMACVAFILTLYLLLSDLWSGLNSGDRLGLYFIITLYGSSGYAVSNHFRSIGRTSSLPDNCFSSLDSDIVGIGIRISVYIQGALISATILLGLFHTNKSPAKEIAVALLTTQASLATILLVKTTSRSLDAVSALLGLTMLDALLAAGTMILSVKDVLAARWLVYLSAVIQLGGFLALGIGVHSFSQLPGNTSECKGLGMPFMGPLIFGTGAPWLYWIHFAYRCTTSIHAVFDKHAPHAVL